MGVLTLGENPILSSSNTKVIGRTEFDNLQRDNKLQKDTYYVTYDSNTADPSSNYGKIFASDVQMSSNLGLGATAEEAISSLNDKIDSDVDDINKEIEDINKVLTDITTYGRTFVGYRNGKKVYRYYEENAQLLAKDSNVVTSLSMPATAKIIGFNVIAYCASKNILLTQGMYFTVFINNNILNYRQSYLSETVAWTMKIEIYYTE